MDKLKRRIIDEIRRVEDKKLLLKLYRILTTEYDVINEPVELTAQEHEALDRAEKDIKEGKLLSEEEAEEKIKKWL